MRDGELWVGRLGTGPKGRRVKGTIRLGRLAGVQVGIHYSWFAVLALFCWSLAHSLLPERYPGWNTATYWGVGLVAALLLFTSVLVHELAHSLVARARGFQVEGITLFLLGGVSNLQADARGARDEFVISVVGPLSSLLLAGLLSIVLLALPEAETPVRAVVWYLRFVNLVLALFNLLPAFPLDGGRVLRSLVWGATGNLQRATRIASRGGQGFGLLLVALAAYEVWLGILVGGVWTGVIGWFLYSAATRSRGEMESQTVLRTVLVRDVMDRHPQTIGPEASVADAVFEHILRDGVRALPVCQGDRLLGIVTLGDVKGLPQERWRDVPVKDVMTPAPLWCVAPEDPLDKALGLLAERSLNQAPVLDDGRLVGLLSRAEIIGFMHSRRVLAG